MRLFLDTNILIEIEKKDQSIIKKIAAIRDKFQKELSITFFNFVEVFYGCLQKSINARDIVVEDLCRYKIFNTTITQGIIYCDLKQQAAKAGRMLPTFDLLIASIVIENDGVLITKDPHFNDIERLRIMMIK